MLDDSHCTSRRIATATAMLAAAALLAACGGGGGSGGDSTASAAQAPTSGTTRAVALAAPVDQTSAAAALVASAPAIPAAIPEVTPAAIAAADTAATALVVRARGDLGDGHGPVMQVRVGGQTVYEAEVLSTTYTDHRIAIPTVAAGSAVDIVFSSYTTVSGEDRNLYVAYAMQGDAVVLPSAAFVRYDRGAAAKAFDGVDVLAGQDGMFWPGALRITWPAAATTDPVTLAVRHEASRFLQQATFGPTAAEIDEVVSIGAARWIARQQALPATSDFVDYFQTQQDQGAAFIPPKGTSYKPTWNMQTFWRTAITAPDPLRKRTAFALQQIFTLSQVDSNLHHHGRAVAGYFDSLNRHAFGNFRQLIEDVALSPAMGIYLSHIRSQKEDGAGRMPDENFARELMQLFTIGLLELNADGTPKKGADGLPIETYSNADVMALARVFTGWSWGFDAAQMTANDFRWGSPAYTTTGAARVDLRPMQNYPAFHSLLEKSLFAGKPWAVNIPAGTPGPESLKLALDGLFKHPNVGPFIGRQLIQRLVTSNPSPAYVTRVAAAFANNGHGVRGDLGAVVRAVLLDAEARPASAGPNHGKLREPVLRIAHLMRSFDAKSATGRWQLEWEFADQLQRPLNAPSVFGFFRPGYVPPNSALADAGLVAPELQIASETTVAAWVNRAEVLLSWGGGWSVTGPDVTWALTRETSLVNDDPTALLGHLDSTLLAGQMSQTLRQAVVQAVAGVPATSTTRDRDRARVALFLVITSPEYLVQR